MRRWVGFIHIDGLYARAELQRGAPPPLAVAERGVVLDACPEARRRGVHPGLPAPQAKRICAGLNVVAYDPHHVRADADRWMRLCLRHAPWLEPLAPHEAFLDFTGCPDPQAAIADAHRAVSETGYRARSAAASNKLVARTATMVPDTFNNPVTLIPHGAEAAFLAPQPVSALWPLPPKTRQRLERLEYDNIAELTAAALAELRAQVGADAPLVHALARGRYPDPVRPDFPPETLRARIRRDDGMERREELQEAAKRIADVVAAQLGNRCCRVLSLWLEMETGARIETRETRRVLDAGCVLPAALRLVERLQPKAPVVAMALIGADIGDPPPLEGDLFTLNRIRRRRALEEAVSCLDERYGKRILFPLAEVPVPWRVRAWQAFWERVSGGKKDTGFRHAERSPKGAVEAQVPESEPRRGTLHVPNKDSEYSPWYWGAEAAREWDEPSAPWEGTGERRYARVIRPDGSVEEWYREGEEWHGDVVED